MRLSLAITLLLMLAIPALGGPPEPPGVPELPDLERIARDVERAGLPIDSAKLDEMEKKLREVDIRMRDVDAQTAKLDEFIKNLQDSIKINEIIIGDDSIIITLDNDSVLSFGGIKAGPRVVVGIGDDDMVGFGSKMTIDEGRIVNGDAVNFFGDIVVNGTVTGGVLTFGGNIYVGSTGEVKQSAVAVFGKVKKEPGGQIANLHIGLRESRPGPHESSSTSAYRIMAIVFLIIYFVWLALSATFSSLLRKNVIKIAEHIEAHPVKSFFLGYLSYALVFVLFIALIISLLGIPLAFLGVPLLLLVSMILSTTAISNLIGARVLHTDQITHQTFLYGTLAFSAIPGLLFLFQLITGSLVLMVFSWILIGLFVFLVVPLGLGAVLSSRFGTRDPKVLLSSPAPPSAPSAQ